jgi:hypothetical protein
MNGHGDTTTAGKFYPKTATLYSAALEDGDFHSHGDTLTSYFLGLFTPFNEKMQVNRIFGRQMYQEYGRQGYTNMLDIGAGPMPRAHEWAPGGRYLYIDHNPDIVAHARRKLGKFDKAIYETGSVGDIPKLFEAGLGTRAFGDNRKIAVGSNAVLMFASDEEIRAAFTYLYDWAARGSTVTISIIGVTAPASRPRVKMIGRVVRWIGAPMYLRHVDTFADLFKPWKMIKGPTTSNEWLGLPPSTKTAGIGFDMYALQLIKE